MTSNSTAPIPEGLNWEMISNVVSITGSIIALGLNIAPVVVFIQICKTKNYKIFPETILIFNILCGLLWFCFWYRVNNFVPGASALSNTAVSLVFTFIYLYYYCEEKVGKWLFSCFIVVDFCVQLFFVFGKFIKDDDITGKTAMIINILQYAAPGQSLLTVLKTGDYTLIPIANVLVGALCSGCWLSFGLINGIMNTIIPNGIGLALSVIQLAIYFYFKCTSEPKEKKPEYIPMKDQPAEA